MERSRQSRGQEGERSFLIAWDDGQALDGALRDPRFTGGPVAIRVWGEWDNERALIFDPRGCPECTYRGPSKAELVSRGIPREVEIKDRHVTFDPEKCTLSARVEARGAVHTVQRFKLEEPACASERRYWAEERSRGPGNPPALWCRLGGDGCRPCGPCGDGRTSWIGAAPERWP